MAFFLNFFGSFKKSAQELKSVRCIAVTAVLIALACILKTLTIQPMPTLKIGFAFVAIASIGMLYGPTSLRTLSVISSPTSSRDSHRCSRWLK